jgi:hypothetical protein
MKQLYSALIEVEMVVLADDEDEARDLIDQHLAREVQDHHLCEFHDVEPVTHINDVGRLWRDSCPYGSDSALTVAQILAEQIGPRAADDRTLPLPFTGGANA